MIQHCLMLTMSKTYCRFCRTYCNNYNTGSETMVSNIVMALTVLMSLKFLKGLLYFTPKAILAAIILSAVPGLIDLKKVYDIWKVDKIVFLIIGVCFSFFFTFFSVTSTHVWKSYYNKKLFNKKIFRQKLLWMPPYLSPSKWKKEKKLQYK